MCANGHGKHSQNGQGQGKAHRSQNTKVAERPMSQY